MKKKIIISVFAAILILAISITAKSMILATIGIPECTGCGACIEEGEPFFLDENNTAWWGIYQSLEHKEWKMRYYGNPAQHHIEPIIAGASACPSNCIVYE